MALDELSYRQVHALECILRGKHNHKRKPSFHEKNLITQKMKLSQHSIIPEFKENDHKQRNGVEYFGVHKMHQKFGL